MKSQFRVITPLSLTVQAVLFAALAGVEFFAPWLIDKFIYRILLTALAVNAVLNLLAFLFEPKKRMIRTMVTALLSAAGLGLVWRFPALLGGGAGIAFGLWALINAIIRLGYAVQLKLTASRGWLLCGIEGLLALSFGGAMLAAPLANLPRINWLIGVYLAILSLSLLGDAVREFFRWDVDGRHFRHRIRIKPPVLLTAFLPTRSAEKLNRMMQTEQLEFLSQLNAPEGVEHGVLEVFFHTGKDVAMGFGHVDFCLRDTFYSYGVYDPSSNRCLNLLSDGVMAVSPREEYLRFATEAENKTLIGFELYLSEEQEAKVRLALTTILTEFCVPWKPEQTEHIVPLGPQDFEARAKTRFFKFVKGAYRTYNTVRTNCVALAEMLVAQSGLPIMQNNGIITPGTYLSFMEREFARKNSIVVKKNVYRARGEK